MRPFIRACVLPMMLVVVLAAQEPGAPQQPAPERTAEASRPQSIAAHPVAEEQANGEDAVEAAADSDKKPNAKISELMRAMQEPVLVPAKPVLTTGTPIWLRLDDAVKVKKAKVGDAVHYVLYRDLYYRDRLLAKAGTPVDADVKKVKPAKLANRGSELVIEFHELRLLNGQTLPLTGEFRAKGEAGLGGQVASGMVDVAGKCSGWPCLVYDIPALPIAGLLFLFTKGDTNNIRLNDTGMAFVSHDIEIDSNAFQARDPEGQTTGKVVVVREHEGLGSRADHLYCNGVVLATLRDDRKLELALKPGFYRFSVIPRKYGWFQFYVVPGSETTLLVSYPVHVGPLNEFESKKTHRKAFHGRTAGEFLRTAHPVAEQDVVNSECVPLEEKVVE